MMIIDKKKIGYVLFFLTMFFSFVIPAKSHDITADIYLFWEDILCPGPDFFDKKTCIEFPPKELNDFLKESKSTRSIANGVPMKDKIVYDTGMPINALRREVFQYVETYNNLVGKVLPSEQLLAAFFVVNLSTDGPSVSSLARYTKGEKPEFWPGRGAKDRFVTYMHALYISPERASEFILKFTDGHSHSFEFSE